MPAAGKVMRTVCSPSMSPVPVCSWRLCRPDPFPSSTDTKRQLLLITVQCLNSYCIYDVMIIPQATGYSWCVKKPKTFKKGVIRLHGWLVPSLQKPVSCSSGSFSVCIYCCEHWLCLTLSVMILNSHLFIKQCVFTACTNKTSLRQLSGAERDYSNSVSSVGSSDQVKYCATYPPQLSADWLLWRIVSVDFLYRRLPELHSHKTNGLLGNRVFHLVWTQN